MNKQQEKYSPKGKARNLTTDSRYKTATRRAITQ